MPRILLAPLIVYAACGLVLSLGLHLRSFNATRFAGDDTVSLSAHLALFPLFLAAVLIWTKLSGTRTITQPNACAIVLPDCPVWLRIIVKALYIYVPVDFAITLARSFTGAPAQGLPPIWGIWMFLYAYALAIFLVAWRRP